MLFDTWCVDVVWIHCAQVSFTETWSPRMYCYGRTGTFSWRTSTCRSWPRRSLWWASSCIRGVLYQLVSSCCWWHGLGFVVQLVEPDLPPGRRKKPKKPQPPVFFAEPVMPSNSFVGTEEYIAPVSETTLSPSLLWNQYHCWKYFCVGFLMFRVFEISAQEIITGQGHSSAVDWWALGKDLIRIWQFSELGFRV